MEHKAIGLSSPSRLASVDKNDLKGHSSSLVLGRNPAGLASAYPSSGIFALFARYESERRKRKRGRSKSLWYAWHFSLLAFFSTAPLVTKPSLERRKEKGKANEECHHHHHTQTYLMLMGQQSAWALKLKRLVKWEQKQVFSFVLLLFSPTNLGSKLWEQGERTWGKKEKGTEKRVKVEPFA